MIDVRRTKGWRRGRVARLKIPAAAARVAGLLLLATAGGGCRQVDEIAAPQVTLPAVEVRSYSGGEADLTLGLTVGNPNPFAITLVAVQGTLFLDGREMGPVGWQGEQECKSKAAVQARIPVHIHLTPEAGADSLLVALVDRREVKQAVRGEMTFARGMIRRTFPIATDGQRDATAR